MPGDGPAHWWLCRRHELDVFELATFGWTPEVVRQQGKDGRFALALDTSLLLREPVDVAVPGADYRAADQQRIIKVKRRATLLGLLRFAWDLGKLNIHDPTMVWESNPWERLRLALTKIEVNGAGNAQCGLAESTLLPIGTNLGIKANNYEAVANAYGRRRVLFACLLTDHRVDRYLADNLNLADAFGPDVYVPSEVMQEARRFSAGIHALEAGRPTIAFGVATVQVNGHSGMTVADRMVLEAVTEDFIPVDSEPEYRFFNGVASLGRVFKRGLVFDGDKYAGFHPDCDLLDTGLPQFPWEVYWIRSAEYRVRMQTKESTFTAKFGEHHGHWLVGEELLEESLARLPDVGKFGRAVDDTGSRMDAV